MASFCPACGRPQDSTHLFCPHCGRPLPGAAAGPTTPIAEAGAPSGASGNGAESPDVHLLQQLIEAEREYAASRRRRNIGFSIGCLAAILLVAVVVVLVGRTAAP